METKSWRFCCRALPGHVEQSGETMQSACAVSEYMLLAQAYDARQAQLTMDTFLTFNERFAKIKSKRLAKAVGGISKAAHPELLLEDGVDEPAPKRRRGSKNTPSVPAGLLPGICTILQSPQMLSRHLPTSTSRLDSPFKPTQKRRLERHRMNR